MEVFKYNRIIVIGNNGSGKSTFARELSRITNIPLIHLDKEYWKPDWIGTPRDEWIAKQEEFINKERWIIEGNYTSTLELRYKAADAIILLEVNRLLCLYSVIKRTGNKRNDMPNYIVERYDRGFYKLCKGIWGYPTRRNTFYKLHDKYPDKDFYVIKGRRRINDTLDKWKSERANKH